MFPLMEATASVSVTDDRRCLPAQKKLPAHYWLYFTLHRCTSKSLPFFKNQKIQTLSLSTLSEQKLNQTLYMIKFCIKKLNFLEGLRCRNLLQHVWDFSLKSSFLAWHTYIFIRSQLRKIHCYWVHFFHLWVKKGILILSNSAKDEAEIVPTTKTIFLPKSFSWKSKTKHKYFFL